MAALNLHLPCIKVIMASFERLDFPLPSARDMEFHQNSTMRLGIFKWISTARDFHHGTFPGLFPGKIKIQTILPETKYIQGAWSNISRDLCWWQLKHPQHVLILANYIHNLTEGHSSQNIRARLHLSKTNSPSLLTTLVTQNLCELLARASVANEWRPEASWPHILVRNTYCVPVFPASTLPVHVKPNVRFIPHLHFRSTILMLSLLFLRLLTDKFNQHALSGHPSLAETPR